jgi:hypothetical protein
MRRCRAGRRRVETANGVPGVQLSQAPARYGNRINVTRRHVSRVAGAQQSQARRRCRRLSAAQNIEPEVAKWRPGRDAGRALFGIVMRADLGLVVPTTTTLSAGQLAGHYQPKPIAAVGRGGQPAARICLQADCKRTLRDWPSTTNADRKLRRQNPCSGALSEIG